ncbi:MAG TPA: hypothetical protein VL135_14630 [Terracidiphilus sp.]|nr:hypothetical protein [Terracidiphilus sp.]
MRKHCKEGLRLHNSFMKVLKEWGLAEADRQAVEMLPLGPIKLKEISQAARKTDAAHVNARRAYAEHISECLVCSRHLVMG